MTDRFNLTILQNVTQTLRRLLMIAALAFTSLAVTPASGAQTVNDGFFQMPLVPDSLKTLQDRTDFMVKHYWDFCDLNKAFSSRDKMASAFDIYLSFMPHASAVVVYEEIPRFMKRIEKKPENVAFIGELAESKLLSDSAEIKSDELFLIFAKEIVSNKKLDKARKLRYQHLIKVLEGSEPGAQAPMFDYEALDGSRGHLEIDSAKLGTILFFNDPECDNCRMARLRLDTDIRTRRIIEGGQMDLVSIYVGEPSDQWLEASKSNPAEWLTIASEQPDDLYDLRHTPVFYVVNPSGKILLKAEDVNVIIDIMASLSERLGK